MAEKKQIHIEVKDKIATLKSIDFQLVGGNSDYEVVFDFDKDWANHETKTAVFVFGEDAVKKPFEGNVCEGVAIEGSTVCYIGVFTGDVITTSYAEIPVTLSITDIGGKPRQPTKDEYNEIIELINKYITNGGGGGGSIIVDQLYSPESVNAQSGIAVAQAVEQLREEVVDIVLAALPNGDEVRY